MRKVVLLYLIFQLTYSVSNAQIKLLDFISPASGAINPTHLDSLGKGGYMVMPTIAERNAITPPRRKLGMLVYVQSVDSIYKLNSSSLSLTLDNSDWVALGVYSAAKIKSDSITLNRSLLDSASVLRAKIKLDSTNISSRITNVDNTSDADKPISTLTQSALDLKANLESPSLTGIPTAPTAANGTSNTQIATTAFVQNTVVDASSSAKGILKLTNDLGGTAELPTVNSVGGVSSSTITTINSKVASATSNNTPSTLVERDLSGNFNAGTISASLTGNVTGDLTGNVTGNLAGNASTTTKLQTARSIYGNDFDGTAPLASAISGEFGGTGVNNGTKTISLGGNISTTADFVTAGSFNTTLVSTGVTNITLPTTGTLATLTGAETLTNKTISSPSLTGTPTATTPAESANGTEVATAAFVLSKVASGQAPDASVSSKGIVQLAGDLGGTGDLPRVNSVGGVISSTITTIASDIASATANNIASTLVKRDNSGNFSANIITASLAGNASTSTQLATARSIYGNSFNGGADLASAITGEFGGTGVANTGKTITLGGNITTANAFTTAGNFSTTLTSLGETNITLPTTGTIATLAGTETLTNKTIVSPSLTGAPTATTPTDAANGTEIATAAFVNSKITSSSNSIGGVSSSTITSIASDIASATSSNTPNSLVKRDGSGNFSAGTITASLAGNASTSTKLASQVSIYGNDFDGTTPLASAITGEFGGTGVANAGKTITLGGNITTANAFTTAGNFSTTLTSLGETNITLPTTGTIATLAGTETLTNKTIVSPTLTGNPTAPTPSDAANSTEVATTAFVVSRITSSSNSIGGVSSSTITSIASDIASATSTNTPNSLVKRDGSGNFSAGIITASLAGNASTSTQLATARSIYGNSFNGGADLSSAITGEFGGTGVANTGKTITLGGNITTANTFTTSGNFSTTLTSVGETNITLPTTGTLVTLNGSETLTNKTISSPTISSPSLTGTPTATTPANTANGTEVATAAFVLSKITSSQASDASADTKGILKLAGDLGGTAEAPTVNTVGGVSSSTIKNIATSITSGNLSNTIVRRDDYGNFSAGTITAALTGAVTGDLTGNVTGNVTGNLAGNASTTTKLQTPRSIYGIDFDGTAALSGPISGTYGGTGVNNGNKTISLGGNITTASDFTTSGSFSTTLISTAATSITLPTTGTLATLSGTETLYGKTLESPKLTGTPIAPTPTDAANGTEVATAAFVVSRITSSSNSIGGVSSSTITSIASDIASATSTNTPNSLVKRDGSGNFSAGTITAALTGNVTGNVTGNLAGNASTTTQLQTPRSIYGSDFDGTSALTGPIAGQYGGTGVANTGKTITLGGNITTANAFTTAGNFSTTLTSLGETNITLPTTGTIATLAGTETLTNKTIVSPTLTGSPTAPTPLDAANSTEVATAAFVNSKITSSSNSIGGVSSSTITAIASDIASATANNLANTLVKRDGSGNFSAATITAALTGDVTGNVTGNLAGNASTTTQLQTPRSIYGNNFDGTAALTGPITGQYGGTGVDNTGKTITLGGNITTASAFTTAGNFSTTLTSLGETNITLPTTGTLVTLNGSETLTNKTISSPTISSPSLTGTPTATTPANTANGTEVATAAFVLSKITSSQASDASADTKGILKLAGDLGGTAEAPTVNTVGGVSSSTIKNIATSITSGNLSNTIVRRDDYGNFSAGTITATLAGNASTSTKLAATKKIYGNDFDGSSDLTGPILAQYGGTGVDNSGKAITLGGNITTANAFRTVGNFDMTLTSTGVTNVTLPTTGTISTLAGTETLTNKTILSPTISSPSLTGSVTAPTPTDAANGTEVATAAFVNSRILSSSNSIGGVSSSTISNIASDIASATSQNIYNTIVKRDGTGDFRAGTITAALIGYVTGNVTGNLDGNASTSTKLAATKKIYGYDFDGSADLTGPILAQYGGTGVANTGKTITLGGNITTASAFATAGSYSTTLTSLGETNITLPTTGTLATLAGTETLTNKTIVSPTLTGSPIAPTPTDAANGTEVATAAFVNSRIVASSGSIGGVSSSTISNIASTIASSTSTNTPNTLVKRDGNGDFSAGIITASLAGNASTSTQLATARSIYGNDFDGTAALTGPISGQYGGTGVNNSGKTITLGGNINTASAFTTSGSFSTTLTSTGETNITLPTTGTLATLNGTEILTNKTISSPSLTGTPTSITPNYGDNSTKIATTAFVNTLLTTSSISGDKISGVIPVVNGGTGQSAFTNGEILIGTTSGTLSKSTITAGSGVSITNGDGSIIVSATGSGGTVTSVNPITVTASGSTFTSTVTNETSTPAISLTIPLASETGTTAGLLSKTDYDIFNAKQGALTAGSGISIVGGTISATGLTTSNLSSSAGITNAQLANNKTTLGSTDLVLGGTYTTITGLSSLTSTNLIGDLTGNVIGNVTGNLTGNVTGNLSGNASTTTRLETARSIYGNDFDGTAALTGPIAGQYGGTGVANTGKTITLGGNITTASAFTTAGTFSTTLTSLGETNITLPTTGTLSTLAGTETLTSKTIVSPTILTPTISSPSLTGSVTAPTPADAANGTEVATAAFVNSKIIASQGSIGGVAASTITTIAADVASATSTNTPSTIVKRDANGDFSANIITATLSGNASTSTKLATARSIYGNDFDGTAALTGPIAGQYGGTGVANTGKTITLGGNITTASAFTTAGTFSTTLTSTGETNITLPTTGTLSTLAGTETLTFKTIVSPTILTPTISSPSLTGSVTAPTPTDAANGTEVATAAFVVARISSSSNSIGGVSSSTITNIASAIASATSSNTANTIVKRDENGNFSSNIITATLSGNASSSTKLQTARSIYGNDFDGTAALTGPITGQYGGTGIANTGKTITLGGNITTASAFTTAGTFSTTLTSTGETNITLPTTGTLATLSGTETLTSKTLVAPTISSPSLTGTPTAPTAATSSNNTQIATTEFVNNLIATTSISSSQISGTIATDVAAATASSTANTIVKRDANSNFSANIITATLAGNASTSTKLQTPRSIFGYDFDGTAALTGTISGTYGGTGVNNGTKTISLGGNISTTADFITAGNYSITLTSTGITNVTLPTTGTLSTLAGTETLTSKTIVSPTILTPTISSPSLTGSVTAPTPADAANGTEVATAAFVNSKIIASQGSIGGVAASTITTIAADVASATSTNIPSTIVKRDANGDFSSNIITATLAGNASTSTKLQTPRSIFGYDFDGTAALTGTISGTYGGTGVNNGTKTISLGGNISTTADFITAGNYSTTLTSTGVTNITLPTTGTLATLSGTETLTSKTLVSPTISSPSLTGTPTAPTADLTNNSTQIATTEYVKSLVASTSISSSQISGTISNDITTATASNTANTIVKRDANGDFSSNIITATLAGNASTSTKLQTPRSIFGFDFDGTAALTGTISGTYGGTGVNNGTKTISLGGNISTTADFITAGNYSTTLTSTGTTIITLPTTGTLATLAGTETLTNKTIVSPTILTPTISSPSLTGTPTAPTADLTTNSTQIATTEYVKSLIASTSINSSQISGTIANDITTATASNTANTIVKRDDNSSFSANIITATLAGNASTSTQLANARSIFGYDFDGTAALTGTISGTFGGTGVNNGTKTISLGGNISTTADFITAGNYSTTLTSTGVTNVTLPTEGTLSTLSGTETLTNKTIASPSLTGTPTSTTASVTANNTQIATTEFVRSRINLDTSYLIQKTSMAGILTDYTATLTSAKTFIDKNDTSNMMQRRYLSDVRPIDLRVSAIESSVITLGTTSMALGGTYTSVDGLSSITSNNFVGTLSGTAENATKLTTARNINGIPFDGTANITIGADAGTLTGTSLASTITSSSLTSVGTITSGVWSGTVIGSDKGGAGSVNGIMKANGAGIVSAAISGTDYQTPITIGSTNMSAGGTFTSVAGLTNVTSTNFIGTLSGTSSTANKLTASKNINGVAFDGSADITVTAASNTLTGTTLASNITSSSLTGVGTITSGVWNGTTLGVAYGGTGLTTLPTSGQIDIGTGSGTFSRTTITPGSGITITNASGSITVATSGITSANLSATAGITNAQLANSKTILGSTDLVLGGTVTSVTGLTNVTSTNFIGTLSGTSSTANKLTATKNINGVAFDGSTDITVTAASNTLTGTTLASNVTASSLTSVGTITTGVWSGTTIDIEKGGTGLTALPSNGQIDIGTGSGTFSRTTLTPGLGISIANGSGSIGITALAGTISGTSLASNVVTSSLTGVGTITSGTWSGTTISVANGGTGTISLTGVLKGNGNSAFTAATEGTDYSFVREVNDEFTVTAEQYTTSNGITPATGVVSAVFTLTNTPNAKSLVKVYINGIRISNSAFRYNTNTTPGSGGGTSSSTPTRNIGYIAINNGSYKLSTGDRIQIDYYW